MGRKNKYTKESEVGEIYGFWEILDYVPHRVENGKNITAKAKVICKKDNCGSIKEVEHTALVKGRTKSCSKHKGCKSKKYTKESEIDRLHGFLKVIDFMPSAQKSGEPRFDARAVVICIREGCNNKKPFEVRYNSLIGGTTVSCGCYGKEIKKVNSTKHGYSRHPYYNTCRSAIDRCNDQNHESYHNYGGRGITCFWTYETIHLFIQYLEKNLPPKEKGLTLDRKENDKGYEPDNLRWATWEQQRGNQRGRITNAEYDEMVKCLTGDLIRAMEEIIRLTSKQQKLFILFEEWSEFILKEQELNLKKYNVGNNNEY